MFEHSVTTGRLGLGLLGLEGEVLGLSALLARDRVEDLFLGLEQRRIRAETACGTFHRFDFGDGRDYLVDGSCSRRRRKEKPCQTSRNLLTGARTRSYILSGISHGASSSSTKESTRRDTLTSFDSKSCCSSCCRAGPRSLSRATLGGISEQMLTIFFVSTHEDKWFRAKRNLILGSITS